MLAPLRRPGSRPALICAGLESLVEPVAEVGVIGLVSGLTAEAERSDERVDPAADGGVADAQLALHLLEVAP